jgi:ribosomal protein S20
MKLTNDGQDIKRLQQLQREQEQLRELMSQIETHAREFNAAIKRKRSHVANIGGLVSSFGLAQQAAAELNEALAGSDYRALMAHISQFELQIRQRQQQVAAQIDELRSRTGGSDGTPAGLVEGGGR